MKYLTSRLSNIDVRRVVLNSGIGFTLRKSSIFFMGVWEKIKYTMHTSVYTQTYRVKQNLFDRVLLVTRQI